jgi:hypothetical protein|tara:strand:- start:16077 stop:16547 length:471 start_codon:yes stop_codon:yes gene_type:complete
MADMSIQNEMRVLDTRDTSWFPSLNDEELKKLSIFVLQRWMSALQSSDVGLQEHYLEYVNEFSNRHYNTIRHYPELQIRLLQIVGHTAGKMRRQHAWIKPHSAGKSSKLGKWIAEHYPHYNDDEIELLVKTNDKEDWKALFEEHGMEPKEIKALLK